MGYQYIVCRSRPGGWSNRAKSDPFPTLEAAIESTKYKSADEWQTSGDGGWILHDRIITAARRQYSWMSIERRWVADDPVSRAKSGKTITIRAVVHGEQDIEVDSGEYAAAKAAGTLDHLLDVYLSDIDTATVLVEPDGTEVQPYA